MPDTIDASLSALDHGARAKGTDGHVQARLQGVQSFLSRELTAIEAVLEQALSGAPDPAPAAARHLVARGGKRVRPLSLLLCARCFAAPTEAPARAALEKALIEMAAVVELVHSATLLHDDVVDEGMERRGVVTSRRLFGNGISVLTGDLLLIQSLERTQAVAPGSLADLIAILGRLVDGEIVQLRGRTQLDVSEATYYRVLRDKTASLFGFSARVGGRLAGATPRQEEALTRFGESLGVAFQLVDDVIDYTGSASGKSLFQDLGEGKLTLPLVLAVRRDPALAELVARLHAGDASVCAEVSERVLASGSCDEVRERARSETEHAIRALAELPAGTATRFLEIVARELTHRAS